ncbi:hypothetical protein ACIRL0_00565 [Streptomyces sp. NPDC102365]|uniref:hypothetical protein n=1 Tax=Streptomyces sp. NPDC102365 TaxID=3366162 RepID=UPI0038085612
MDESTDTSPGAPTAIAYCAWHGDIARGVRLINVHEAGSGPGGGSFACPACMSRYGLVPFADRPL